MKIRINSAKRFLREGQEGWKMESSALFFLLIVSQIQMVGAGTGDLLPSERIGTGSTP